MDETYPQLQGMSQERLKKQKGRMIKDYRYPKDRTKDISKRDILAEWEKLEAERSQPILKNWLDRVGRELTIFPHLPNLRPEDKNGLHPNERRLNSFRRATKRSWLPAWRDSEYKFVNQPASFEESLRFQDDIRGHALDIFKTGLDERLTHRQVAELSTGQRDVLWHYKKMHDARVRGLDPKSSTYKKDVKEIRAKLADDAAGEVVARGGLTHKQLLRYIKRLYKGLGEAETYYIQASKNRTADFYRLGSRTTMEDYLKELDKEDEEATKAGEAKMKTIIEQTLEYGKRIMDHKNAEEQQENK